MCVRCAAAQRKPWKLGWGLEKQEILLLVIPSHIPLFPVCVVELALHKAKDSLKWSVTKPLLRVFHLAPP